MEDAELDLYGEFGGAGAGAGKTPAGAGAGAAAAAGAGGAAGGAYEDELASLSVYQLRAMASQLRGELAAACTARDAAERRAEGAEAAKEVLVGNVSAVFRTAVAELGRQERRANDALARCRRGEDVRPTHLYTPQDQEGGGDAGAHHGKGQAGGRHGDARGRQGEQRGRGDGDRERERDRDRDRDRDRERERERGGGWDGRGHGRAWRGHQEPGRYEYDERRR